MSEAIFQTLKEQFLKTPNCQKEWRSISNIFEDKCNFLHCVGSLDGKVSTSPSSVQKCQEHIITTTALCYLIGAYTGVTLTVVACPFSNGGDDGKW